MPIKITRSIKSDLKYKDAKREIFSDNEFVAELKELSTKRGIEFNDAMAQCQKYLKEIAARCTENRQFWGFMEFVVRKRIIERFDNIYYDKGKLGKINDIVRENILAIVPNHRSVFDFIILAYVLVKETSFMPIILAADIFNRFPMGFFFRKTGAYFVRRNETDELYHAVFRHYVMLILKYELVHLFFIEGGRNKTGAYSEPKAGILRYIIEGKKKYNVQKEIVFLPVNISYDCVPESNVVIKENLSGERRSIFSSVSKYMGSGNLGNCYINFGEPVYLSGFLNKIGTERENIKILGHSLIDNIMSLVTVSPIALMCYTINNKSSVSVADFNREFKYNFDKLSLSRKNIGYIELNNIPDYLSFANSNGIINYNKDEGIISIDMNKKRIVEYYSNNIRHLLKETSINMR